MRISFFAALRTFLPSFFRNFLHVYIFIVVLSLALKISQNSSLKDRIAQVFVNRIHELQIKAGELHG